MELLKAGLVMVVLLRISRTTVQVSKLAIIDTLNPTYYTIPGKNTGRLNFGEFDKS